MSTVKSKKLQVGTDATSTNNFTIYQPASPDGTLRIGVGNADSPTEVAQFNSTGIVGDGSQLTAIPAPAALTTASGSAPSYSARAWVNFNGTGTVAIRASGNVSSITDNNTGDYTINFTTAMPDSNYAIIGSAQGLASGSDVVHFGANGYSGSPIIAPATTNCKVGTFAYSGAGADSAYVMVGIFK